MASIFGIGLGGRSGSLFGNLSKDEIDTVVNTVIGEAANQGAKGMAAVASVIRNRAAEKGKSPAEIVAEPHQFAAFSNPGAKVQKDMQDPALRAEATQIVQSIFSGDVPDPTDGADHYHADSVTPDWANSMAQTTKIGDHIFYRSGQKTQPVAKVEAPGLPSYESLMNSFSPDRQQTPPAQTDGQVQNQDGVPTPPTSERTPPFDAILTPDRRAKGIAGIVENPERGMWAPVGNFVARGADKVDSRLVDVLQSAAEDFPGYRLEAFSGYRPGDKRFHGKGEATDVRLIDLKTGKEVPNYQDAEGFRAYEQFAQKVRQVQMEKYPELSQNLRWGGYFSGPKGKYGAADLMHFDLGGSPGLGMAGGSWDDGLTSAQRNYFPGAESVGMRALANTTAAAKPGSSKKTIMLDDSFKPADGLKMFGNGATMLGDIQAANKASADASQASASSQSEQNRMAGFTDMHNRETDAAAARLNEQMPGRYVAMDPQQAEQFQQDWQTKNQSAGAAGDTVRNWTIGAASSAQQLGNVNRLIISKLPYGDKINATLDNIDRFFTGGMTSDELNRALIEKEQSELSPEGKAAAEKKWFASKGGLFGPAWSDPRSYLGFISQSAPSTIATMLPSGMMARGAYLSKIAAGAAPEVAAAAAAKTATIAGKIGEGFLGGAQSAQTVKDEIARIPRDQLAQSESVKAMMSQGKSLDEAIAAISSDAQTQAFLVTGVTTGIFGGSGDKALAKIIAEGVRGGVVKRAVRGMLRDAIAEGVLEEMPQNVTQQMSENAAMQKVDPNRSLMQDVPEAAMSGLAGGVAMGGPMGATAGIVSKSSAEHTATPEISEAIVNGGVAGAASKAETTTAAPENAAPVDDGYIRVNPDGQDTGAAPGQTPVGADQVAPQQPVPAQATTPIETSQDPAAAPTTREAGPIGRSVGHAERSIAERAQATQTGAPVPNLQKGVTVRVDQPGIDPFMGTVDSLEGNEAIIMDASTGELLQVPVEAVTQIAASPADIAAGKDDTSVLKPKDALPETSSDPALEPAPPKAADVTTEPLPPPTQQRPATERFPSAPLPGERIIVDDGNGGRFAATVKTYENGGKEAVVQPDQGDPLQVPTDKLFISNQTPAQVEAEDLKRNPPIPRDVSKAGPNARNIYGKAVVMPDDVHARLFDLGRERNLSKKTMGASQLDLGGVGRDAAAKLATDMGISPEAVGTLADDYRYRVERSAKNAQYAGAIKMPEVDPRRLRQWQRDHEKATGAASPATDNNAEWWDGELTAQERRQMLDTAGVKRSEKLRWAGMTPAIREKLLAQKQTEDLVATIPANTEAAATEDWHYPDHIEAAAHEAATSPRNDLPEPTEAQKEAGNYKLGHIKLGGLDISIENPAGSSRSGVDANGKPWSVEMKSHYGYIKGTVGRDKDHVDIFVKPGTAELDDSSPMYVVDQISGNGRFDEHKVMAGFDSADAARRAYLENYTKDWKGLGALTETTLGGFKEWLANGDTTKKFAATQPAPISATANTPTPAAAVSDIVDADKTPSSESAKAQEARAILAGVPDGGTVKFVGMGDDMQPGSWRVEKIGNNGQATLRKVFPGAQPTTFSLADLKRETRGDGRFFAEVSTKAPAAPRKPKPAPYLDRYENYFRPGRNVPSYMGTDRVESFDRGQDNMWSVKVRAIKKDGSLGEIRTHSTAPNKRDLEKWERENPVPPRKKLPATDNTVTKENAADRAQELLRDKMGKLSEDGEETGPFGPVLRGYEGNWKEAALELERRQTGDAIGALHHVDVGPIDLVWGRPGTNAHNGAGLSKLIAWHPEVLADLQGFIDRLHVDEELSSPRRIQLRDASGNAGVRLDYDGVAKTWLLTAFESGTRLSRPSGLTLNQIWKGEKAGRDASSGTVPLEPSDAGWGRRTGDTNIGDDRADVQSAREPRLLQPMANKRPDPKMTHVEPGFLSRRPPKRAADESIAFWAQNTVLNDGKKTGNEYIIAIDDDGSLVEYGTTRQPDRTGMSPKLAGALWNPDRRLAIYHNHPRNTPLSATDIAVLAYPGAFLVGANGHKGRNTRASLTVGAEERARRIGYQALYDLIDSARRSFMTGPMRQAIETADRNAIFHALPSELASRAGIIDFEDNLRHDFSRIPELDAAIDKAAETLKRNFHGSEAAARDADARIHRSAEPLRHIGSVEDVAEEPGKPSGNRSEQGGLAEGSARYGAEKDRRELEQNYGRVAATRDNIISAVKGAIEDKNPSILATVPLNYFPELANGKLPAIDDYLLVKRKMDAYRSDRHEQAAAIIDKWRKYISLGFFRNNQAKAAHLSALMHDSTLAGIDPSEDRSKLSAEEQKTKSPTEPKYVNLRARYLEMPPLGRQLFQEVRDAYREQADETDRLLLDNIRKAQEVAKKHAERDYKARIAAIEAEDANPIDKRRKLEAAKSSYDAANTRSEWASKARMTTLRRMFESNRVEDPYFPLSRFGDYFASVRGKSTVDDNGVIVPGPVMHFGRYESKAEMDRALRDLKSEFDGKDVDITSGRLSKSGEIKSAMDPKVIGEIDRLLQNSGVGNDIRDALYQRWLETMPDLSMRKRAIHRKGTAGFNTDAYRVYASTAFHAGHQMARLKYGVELQENVNQAEEQAKAIADNTREMALVNELQLRHQWVKNPQSGSLVNWLTSLGFVYYMGVSPAAAVVNASQTWMVGLPVIGSRFGFGKSTAALLKASHEFLGAVKNEAKNAKGAGQFLDGLGDLRNTPGLSADDKAAMDAFYQSGLIDRTQSHDLASIGETGTKYNPLRAKLMKVASWSFHKVEVYNRSVTALATYRLARESGQSHLEAINTAHTLTYAAHFDMSNSSRPRITQNDTMRALTMFRSFQINMLFRIGRDMYQAVKAESPQARREARWQLAGITGMMALNAGLTGTIGYGFVMAAAEIIRNLFGDDDDPLSFEERFKADVMDILGPRLGGIVLKGVPGELLGIDLTSRIGMPDFWLRSSDRELDGDNLWNYWVEQTAGAGVALGHNFYKGIGMMMDGKVERGIENMVPKFVRDMMRAGRYAADGVETLRGDEILPAESINWRDLAAQTLGFTPAKIDTAFEINNVMKNAEKRMTDKRKEIVNGFAEAVENDDAAAREKAMEKIRKYNASPINRLMPITSQGVKQSLATRARNRAKMVNGVLIKNKALSNFLQDQVSSQRQAAGEDDAEE